MGLAVVRRVVCQMWEDSLWSERWCVKCGTRCSQKAGVSNVGLAVVRRVVCQMWDSL